MVTPSLATAIQLSELTKRFGDTTAVNKVSFSVKTGEVVGFVGPNGAGKTTTIGLLLGFLRSNEGVAEVMGKRISPENAHLIHRDIGYVAGDMALFDDLTAEQYLAFLANLSGGAPRQAELLGILKPRMGEKLKRLSRGNKQKVALVGAFQHNPSLAILDEPTSGLDPLMQETFLNLIRNEYKRGATIFMSSHILSEVTSVCSRVIFMKQGRVITDKPVKELEAAAGKIITLTTSSVNFKTIAGRLPDGATLMQTRQKTISLRFNGDVAKLTKWLTAQPFTDLTIEDRNLDDIFHDLYKDDDREVR